MAGENSVVEAARTKEITEEELTKVMANGRAEGEEAHASVRKRMKRGQKCGEKKLQCRRRKKYKRRKKR